MNTNNTPVEFPIWHRGQIFEAADPNDQPAPTEIPEPGQNASHPDASAPSANNCDPPEPVSDARQSPPADSAPRLKTPPERHSRKCAVCNHEDREAIEEAYLNWTSPEHIARQFDLRSYVSVYRHVEAVGLATLRRRRKHAALDLIIERAGHARVTGGDVIRAIITSARIGDDGEYNEPVRRTQINHNTTSDKPISNRKPKLLETP